MASLYPDSGGRVIDGVIAMDPYVVAELMRFTGPIEVPELDVTVAAEDAAEFILRRPVRSRRREQRPDRSARNPWPGGDHARSWTPTSPTRRNSRRRSARSSRSDAS